MTPAERARAQKQHCIDTQKPLFAPQYGSCYNCNRNIYTDATLETPTGEKETSSGIKDEAAANTLITACPHCKHSFTN